MCFVWISEQTATTQWKPQLTCWHIRICTLVSHTHCLQWVNPCSTDPHIMLLRICHLRDNWRTECRTCLTCVNKVMFIRAFIMETQNSSVKSLPGHGVPRLAALLLYPVPTTQQPTTRNSRNVASISGSADIRFRKTSAAVVFVTLSRSPASARIFTF
jgi:hypothetical protein